MVVSPNWTNWAIGETKTGAVTWGNSSNGGITGIVSPANSIIGAYGGSKTLSVVPLSNGNFVVESSVDAEWDTYAVTWGDGAQGTIGKIGAGMSLVASSRFGSMTPLSNGNYVFGDPDWVNPDWLNPDTNQVQPRKVGAVMWVDGGMPRSGSIVAADSLVGNGFGLAGIPGDSYGYAGVVALEDGNYVVCTANFSEDGQAGTPKSIGAVTWGDGVNGTRGVVSTANSVVGASTGDSICRTDSYSHPGAVPLADGAYLVRSPRLSSSGIAQAGAVTWVEGGGPGTGVVTAVNSLTGTLPNEGLGGAQTSIFALSNGNYVLGIPAWSAGGTLPGLGAATFGIAVTTGEVSAQNSLVGTQINDALGSGGVVTLSGGRYLVKSPFWHNSAGLAVGALTIGTGESALHGALSPSSTVFGDVENQGATMTYAFDALHDRLVVGQPSSNKVTLLTINPAELFIDGFE